MEKIIIKGGYPLDGNIRVSGMKNSALPVIFACIMVEGDVFLGNIPDIADVDVALNILARMGAYVRREGDLVHINCDNVVPCSAPDELASKMRASYYILGAELGRFHQTKVARPGGCNLGIRGIDLHVRGFQMLGASMRENDYTKHVEGEAPNGLIGATLSLDNATPTVGGTINHMLAAIMAEGTTIIENAAREPQITDLQNFLNQCARGETANGKDAVTGAATGTIRINGVKRLRAPIEPYEIIPDMIEAGTFMIAAAATGSTLSLENVIPKHLESLISKLREIGVVIDIDEAASRVVVSQNAGKNGIGRINNLHATNVHTLPYPGFATDLQPQIGALLCLANGKSTVTESIFENRFGYVEQLRKMGAIAVVGYDKRSADIHGPIQFEGIPVTALDLRCGAALIIAGLAASGETIISDIFHIERGYDDIVGKLRSVGANIIKI